MQNANMGDKEKRYDFQSNITKYNRWIKKYYKN